MTSLGVFSQEKDGEQDNFYCFPLDTVQARPEAEGSGRGYAAINQSQNQFEMGEQGLNMPGAKEALEDQIQGDSQSLLPDRLRTPPQSRRLAGKGKSRASLA